MTKQVSFTQVMTYVRCPQHYLFRYVLGIKHQPRKAFKRGFALHETLQYHFEQKKLDGKGISPAQAKEFFLYSFENAMEEYQLELAAARPYLTREYLAKERWQNVGDMIDAGMKGLEVYYKRLNPYIVPDMIEESFEFPVEKGVTVMGKIDLTDAKGVIHELKTTKITPNKQDIRADAQLAIYQLGYKTITGKAPTAISKDYIVLSKKNSRIVRFRVVKPFINKRVVLGNIIAILDSIRNNIFYCVHPAESWICSKEWCSYYKLHQELKRMGFQSFMEKYSTTTRGRR